MVYMPTPEWMGKPGAPQEEDEIVVATHLDWLTPPESEIDRWLQEFWGEKTPFSKAEKQYFSVLSGKLALLVAASETADNQYERWLGISNPLCPARLKDKALEWVVHIIGMTCDIKNNNDNHDALKLHRLEQLEQHPEWVIRVE